MRVDPVQPKAEYFIMVGDRLQLIKSLREDTDRNTTYNVSLLGQFQSYTI